jgi:hypothetical protein
MRPLPRGQHEGDSTNGEDEQNRRQQPRGQIE